MLLHCLLSNINPILNYLFNFIQLFETSAKDDSQADHVESIFLTLAHKLKNSSPMMPVHMSQWDEGPRRPPTDDDIPGIRLQSGLSACRPVSNENCYGC